MATKEQVKPKNLAAAMIEAQQNMKPLFNSADNPFFKSKYAPLSDVNEAAIPALNAAGIAVFQGASTNWDGQRPKVYVSVRFVHADSGEEIAEEMAMIPEKSTPQAIGSAITYARRYLLTTMAGLAAMDDDGNEASQPAQKQQQPRRQARREPNVTLNNVPEVEGGQADVFNDPTSGATANKAIDTKSLTFKRFQAVGTELYGKEWSTKRHALAESVSDGRTKSSTELTIGEVKRLIVGMESKLQPVAA